MNMDIKELIAKITGKNKDASSGGKRKKNSISAFFEKNPKMKFVIAALAIVISVAVAVIIAISSPTAELGGETEENNVVPASSSQAQVLPQIERDHGADEYEGDDPFDENVLDQAKLVGVMDAMGFKTATLETKGKTYQLHEGDNVGDSEWIVSEITNDSITISMNDKTKTYKK